MPSRGKPAPTGLAGLPVGAGCQLHRIAGKSHFNVLILIFIHASTDAANCDFRKLSGGCRSPAQGRMQEPAVLPTRNPGSGLLWL
ncbi:hypothetical protein D3C77_642080 [compost metagenome]